MPNIFQAIDSIKDDDLRLQIALLRSVSLGSAFTETGRRALGKLTQWVNTFANPKKTEGADPFVYRVVTVSDMVKEQMESLKPLNRKELDKRMRDEVFTKCHELDANRIFENMDPDTLSVWMIREAGKIFAVSESISPANMAVQIQQKYNERLLSRLHKMLVAQNPAQVKETNSRIQMELNKVPMDMMRNMASRLTPPEFSGTGIGKAIRAEQGTVKLGYLVDLMGYEPFDKITLRIWTVYDLLIGLNRTSRVQFAEIIWLALGSFGRKFTYASDLLPSFTKGKSLEAYNDDEKEYMTKIAARRDYKKKIAAVKLELTKSQEKAEKAREAYEQAQEQKDKADNDMKLLESVKNTYIETEDNIVIKSQEEIRKYYASVTKASRNVDWAYEALEKERLKYEASARALRLMQEKYNSLDGEFAALREETDHLIAVKSREIALQWKAYFFRFTFDEVIFSVLVTEYTRSELILLEEYLKEMHDSRNPDGYSLWTETEEESGNTVKYSGIKCKIGPHREVKVLYSGTFIRKIWSD